MICLLAAALLPLLFSAPGDTLGVDAAGRVRLSPVSAYVFLQIDEQGRMVAIPGYADSTGTKVLTPHAPGTRETVWLAPTANRTPVTIYVLSRDESGNLSAPSNACVMGPPPASLAVTRSTWALEVPLVEDASERCGQAALAMVLGYYGADPAAIHEVNTAYDPAVRGPRIDDLAGVARRAGYEATVTTLTPDSLINLLNDGVPPILLFENELGHASFRNYGVVTGWDAAQASFTLQDGTARPRVAPRDDLVKSWSVAGSQALIVRPGRP